MKPQFLFLVSLLHLAAAAHGSPPDGGVERVSVGLAGAEADFLSLNAAISADGRFVAFESVATNLVAGDTNGDSDIFLYDRQTGTTVRVSRSSGGAQANEGSASPSISANGRYIVFESRASNLVAGDTNNRGDIFLHDRITGFTTRVSVTTSGAQADDHSLNPAISGDGQFVAFASNATNLHVLGNAGRRQIYVRDIAGNRTTLCSVGEFLIPGNGSSNNPNLSHDGNRVVFESLATNLTTVDDPTIQEIYLYERTNGTVSMVSRGLNGVVPNDYSRDPVISGDGASIAFGSHASNLIPGGTLGSEQIFLYDIASDSTAIVSKSTSGSHGDFGSVKPSISGDGKRVAFESPATNLSPGDTDSAPGIFIHEVTTSTTVCMTRLPDGQPESGFLPALAAGGDFIAFGSPADGFVPGDTAGIIDVFVRDYGALSRNAGSNPQSYTASRPVLGEEWRGSVDLTTTGHTFAILYGKITPTNAALGGGQRLLIAGPTIFKLPAQPGPVASWSGILPSDLSLAGQPLYTQAVHLLGVSPFALSNAQDLCLGY